MGTVPQRHRTRYFAYQLADAGQCRDHQLPLFGDELDHQGIAAGEPRRDVLLRGGNARRGIAAAELHQQRIPRQYVLSELRLHPGLGQRTHQLHRDQLLRRCGRQPSPVQHDPVCPNGILSLASGLSTVNSMGTTWDNLGPSNSANAYTQALTIIPASQVNSIGDNYLTDSGVWNLLPPPTIAATSNEIQSPCPFSINEARGYKYRSDCGMSPGQIIAFPVDETIGNNWGSFDIYLYGSIVCHYDYGNASHVTLHGPIENVTGTAAGCTAIQNNAGTINVYGDSDHIYIQNNTTQGNTEVLVGALTGAHE